MYFIDKSKLFFENDNEDGKVKKIVKIVALLFVTILLLLNSVVTVMAAENYVLVAKWGCYDAGDGQFINPGAAAVDSGGNVYVADTQNYRIQKFAAITANRSPELNSIGNKTVDEGQPLVFAVSATDPDGDTVTLTAAGLPVGA